MTPRGKRSLPLYVKRFDEPMMRPPYELGSPGFEWQACGFFLPADRSALSRICDRELNDPLRDAAIRCDLAASRVLLTFNRYKRARSRPRRGDTGSRPWLGYEEVIFMVPVVLREPREEPRLCWYLPVIYIDGAPEAAVGMYPIVMGRELYGFAKTFGDVRFEIRNGHLHDGRLAVFVPGKSGKLGLEEAVVVTSRGAAQDAGGSLPFQAIAEAAGVGCDPCEALGGRLIGLKQFRDPERFGSACYQALVETPLEVDPDDYPTQMSGPHRVTFRGHGLAIARYLGLELRKQAGVAAPTERFVDVPAERDHSYQWQARLDFARGSRVLWEAPGQGLPPSIQPQLPATQRM